MRNADKPAYPARGANGALFTESDDFENWSKQSRPLMGLTKREMFAMAAMQGLLAAHPDQIHNQYQGAGVAIKWADELLKQLEH